MPRIEKGPRLWYRPESRKSDGTIRNKGGFYIRDGATFRSTGCSLGDRAEAEKQLAHHIALKHTPQVNKADPADTLIAEIINIYLKDKVPHHARPHETAARLINVLAFFGDMKMRAINGGKCRDYARQRTTPAAARRELEDLRAALGHFEKEGYVMAVPKIVLPEKSPSRFDFLTRTEAAKLLRAAWRMRQTWKGQPSDRPTGRHLARFLLVALYTGTRSGAICSAAIRPTEGTGYVDLERGVFFRRANGARKTKKRQPPVRLPTRLLAHLKRWEKLGISKDFVVEWQGKPVQSIDKSFATARTIAGLRDTITPHILRHTAATWLMQAGADMWLAAGFLGMTIETLQEVYGHHHPDFQSTVANAISSPRNPHRNGGNKREHEQSNVVQLIEKISATH